MLLLLVLATLVRGGPAAAQPPGPDARPRKVTDPESAAVERRLTDAVRRNPDSFDAHHALAAFYLHEGNLDAAIPHLRLAQTIDPSHYATGYDLALALSTRAT